MRSVLVAAVLSAAALSGCGGAHSSAPLSPGLPDCAVWKVGGVLPSDYAGACFLGDPDVSTPAHGRCRVYTYGKLWARAGGVIRRSPGRVARDQRFREALDGR